MRFFSIPLLSVAFVIASGGLPLRGQAVREDGAIEEDLDGDEGCPGVVSLSDGTNLRGKLSFTGGKRLRIYDADHRRVHYLDLEQIEVVRTLVEEEKLEEAWAFEEGGSPKKIALGWTYPLRKYSQEIQLHGGQVLRGHCYATVLYVAEGTREHKVVVPRVQRGRRDQALDDLVYPRTIELESRRARPPDRELERGAERPAPFAEVAGRIPGLAAVTLIEIRQGRGYSGAVRTNGEFRARGLLPGEYAVFLRRGREIRVGFPDGDSELAKERPAVVRKLSSLAEFFDDKRVCFVGGKPDSPWVLLELRRRGPTTLAESSGSSARVLRWEIWRLERDHGGWRIGRRVFLDREVLRGSDEFPSTDYVRDPGLWKYRLRPGRNRLAPVFENRNSS